MTRAAIDTLCEGGEPTWLASRSTRTLATFRNTIKGQTARAKAARLRRPRRRDRLGNYERLPDEVPTEPPAA